MGDGILNNGLQKQAEDGGVQYVIGVFPGDMEAVPVFK